MKIKLVTLISILTLILLTGCTDTDVYKQYVELQVQYGTLQDKYTELEGKYTELGVQYEEMYTEANRIITEYQALVEGGGNTSGGTNNRTVKEVYSDVYVTLSYSHCETGKVFFLVENKISEQITIGVDSLAIDGWNLSDAFGVLNAAAMSKGYISIASEELTTLSPKTISGGFIVAGDTRDIITQAYSFSFNSTPID